MASDDFYYLYLKNTYGAWGGMIFQYDNWSGRWTAHSVACWLLKFHDSPIFLPLMNFGTLAALYLTLRNLIQKIFNSLSIKADGILLPGLTIMLITSFFFATFNIGESWFWYIIVITYMWSLICFLFLIHFIFSKTSNAGWIFASLAALFIGGASESFALIFMFLLVALFFFRNKIYPDGFKTFNNKIYIIFTLIFISFLIAYLAPGTDVRRSLLPHTTLLFKAWSYIKTLGKYFIMYLPAHAGYIFIFSFPWLLFGMKHLKGKFAIEEKRNILKKVSLFFLAFIALSLIPTTYVMSEAGPDRAMLLLSLFTAIYFAFLFAIGGTYVQPVKLFKILSVVICDFSILVMLIFVYAQSELTNNFSDAYDKRMAKIEIAKEKRITGFISVSPLPESGMLYWEELSSDSTYFVNRHFQKGLGLPFNVITAKK